MATIKDVARLADVSVTTVSATINGTAPVSKKLQQQVWDAINEVGYKPNPVARDLRSGTSTTIGLIVPDIASPYSANLAKSMQLALSRLGYRMFFSSNDDDPEREAQDIDVLMRHRVSGFAIMPTSLGDGYTQKIERAIKAPAVLVDRILPNSRFSAVTDDNQHGARLLVRYLVKLGHRDIAILTGRPGISSSDERLEGFLETAAEAGISIREDLVCRAVHRTEQALMATQQLMTLASPPTAILSINIAQTRGIMIGLKNMGLSAPRDVSVASFDGFHASEGWTPGITSLSQDMQMISDKAASLLLAAVNGTDAGQKPVTLRVPPRFEIRESCCSPQT